MGSFSIWHWMIVLLVVVLIFGTRKLKDAGRDLGGAVRSFKEGLAGPEGTQPAAKPAEAAPVIEGESARERHPS